MSVQLPRVNAAFGSYTLAESDIIQCRVHLGCTKEVSSFELLLQNWDGKYSPNGSYPLSVGLEGYVKIGRGSFIPQVITGRIEALKYESTANEHYIRVSGRCQGEKLFRRVFTGTFTNQKGEDIVKYLLDNYVGLSHVRDSTELVEATDTTYAKLEYKDTPVIDIIKYIADSADKQGVIGYDFRVAPDGKFEFFPRNSKTSLVSLSELIEEVEYRKDIHRIRNKITVYGAAAKKLPTDNNDDGYTESTTDWMCNALFSVDTDHVSQDGLKNYTDSYSILGYGGTDYTHLRLTRLLPGGVRFNGDFFKQINVWIKWTGTGGLSDAKCILWQSGVGKYFELNIKNIMPPAGSWAKLTLRTDSPLWVGYNGASWSDPVVSIEFHIWLGGNSPQMALDHLHFTDCRYSATEQDTNSQNAYGLRELVQVDEELYSDNECTLRAKALLNHLKTPAEQLTIKSTVISYGTTPILPGDKIHVTLPNEGVDADYRIETVEYYVDAKTQTLEITLELGRETPLLADYIYALRSKTDHLSRYKAARMI